MVSAIGFFVVLLFWFVFFVTIDNAEIDLLLA